MVAEPSITPYTDVLIQAAIERYPVPDENGEEPRIAAIDMTRPVTYTPYMDALDLVTNPDWKETYDMNAAAADIWAEKAGAASVNFNFTTNGQTFDRTQVYEAYMKQSRYYAARRTPVAIKPRPQPHQRYRGGVN